MLPNEEINLEEVMKKENRDVFKAFTLVSQIGINVITTIGLCSISGYYLDKHFKTNCWFIILCVLGVITAFRNIYYLTRGFYAKDLKREEEELQYWKELKKNSSSEKKREKH